MIVKFKTKFTDLEIDDFIDQIHTNLRTKPQDTFEFDLTETEFIGNQELLVFTAVLKSFIDSSVVFRVKFLKPFVNVADVNERVKKQIIQIWTVWKIFKIIPNNDYNSYFDIDGNVVERLAHEINYEPKNLELYNRNGITPFIPLDFINNYNEKDVQKTIEPIYKLNNVVEELLKRGNCHHPFTTNALSTIITEELYLNFLDHAGTPSLGESPGSAYMSISFLDKLHRQSQQEIQIINKLNFETECLKEALPFYYDIQKKLFKNTPYIQFSFLDFGKGIPFTIKQEYEKNNPTGASDTELILYALRYNTSRHPIVDPNHLTNKSIPRGLFDAITIIKRYKGLAVIRSLNGKILLDFSNEQSIENAWREFGDSRKTFPGTLISIYIPAIEKNRKILVSAIKPELVIPYIRPVAKNHISVTAILQDVNTTKQDLYNSIIAAFRRKIDSQKKPSILFVSFAGCEKIERRVIKKLLYFLSTTYDINQTNNVVVMDGPSSEIIREINEEMLSLNEAIRNYKIHPLPIVNYEIKAKTINLEWIGVYNSNDKKKLNQLLFEDFSLAMSDFEDPSNLTGHINYFDEFGNLKSNLPSHNEIEKAYFTQSRELLSKQIGELLVSKKCIRQGGQDTLFLCNGNYYQKQFIDLSTLINDQELCDLISYYLYQCIISATADDNIVYIGISATSQRMLKSLEKQGIIKQDDSILLDDEQNMEYVLNHGNIKSEKKYILVCDVISTGFLTTKINKRLAELGAQLDYIAVIVSTLSHSFELSKSFLSEFNEKIITLHKQEIPKLRRDEIKDFHSKKIIRINPHTNIPITLSIDQTDYNESVLFKTEIGYDKATDTIKIYNKFLEFIPIELIRVGFLNHNNVIHPYFFNTFELLKKITKEMLAEILGRMSKDTLKKEKIHLFYPRKSGIEGFNLDLLKSALSNHAIEASEIERFGTPEGWKFPHNSDYLNIKAENNVCLILDDGSCSGDSLIQMIDEIAFYKAKEIIVLCFIGRLADHKRELFSRLAQIRVMSGQAVEISIFFISHWHIPTYFSDENPNIREKKRLNDLIDLQNTPLSIKRIAGNIVKEITPKEERVYKDYKYLPKTKANTKTIPKKELLLVRDEIGKVIGYRLYKESFTFFDHFMYKYASQRGTSKDRYREIELLCATFVYEPYLYDKISSILPDVSERIEEFVRLLITDDRIYPMLTYSWDKLDIVHLFFIVFKNEKLIEQFTEPLFRQLINFNAPSESALNYVLYKLLGYFSLKANELQSQKFDTQIKNILHDLKDKSDLKEVRKYYNYICSLPSKEDFSSQLQVLRNSYEHQNEPQLHDQRSSFNHNVSIALAALREGMVSISETGKLDPSKISAITSSWFEMLEFINPILTFSSSFKDFVAPYPYYRLAKKIDGENSSIRQMVGYIEEVIFSLGESYQDMEKLKIVDKYINKIQTDIGDESIFHKIIQKPYANANKFVAELSESIAKLPHVFNGSSALSENARISMPEEYLERLVKDEIATNLSKYADTSGDNKIILSFETADNQLMITIKNKVNITNIQSSTGEGLKCLRLLGDCPLFGFTYTGKLRSSEFNQILTFTIQ